MSKLVDDFVSKINNDDESKYSRFIIPSVGLIDYEMTTIINNPIQTNRDLYANATNDIVTLSSMLIDVITSKGSSEESTVVKNVREAISGFASAAKITSKRSNLSATENIILEINDCLAYALQLSQYLEMNFPYVMETEISIDNNINTDVSSMINELQEEQQQQRTSMENIDIS